MSTTKDHLDRSYGEGSENPEILGLQPHLTNDPWSHPIQSGNTWIDFVVVITFLSFASII